MMPSLSSADPNGGNDTEHTHTTQFAVSPMAVGAARTRTPRNKGRHAILYWNEV